MSLDDVVRVSITTQTTGVSRTGFGTPMVLSHHSRFPERARRYASLQALRDDGFSIADPAYRCAQALFSQNPRVNRVILGRATRPPTMKYELTPHALDDTDYLVKINATRFTFHSTGGATDEAIAVGLEDEINNGNEPVTASHTAGVLAVTSDTSGTAFTLEVDRAKFKQSNETDDPGVADDIGEVQVADDDWYSLHLTSTGGREIAAAAAYIESQQKLLVTSSADDALLDPNSTTDVGALLNSAGYARTALIYHPQPHTYPGAAWAGAMLPTDPGSATWKFKTLQGISSQHLSGRELAALDGKRVNHYTQIAGVSITQQGVSTGDEFVDITRFVDFLRSRLQENIYSRLINLPKVPYTNAGVAIIENEIRGVLGLGVSRGGLAPDPEPEVFVPDVSSIDSNTRATRLLPDVRFNAALTGAVHQLEIQGAVTV